MKIKNISFPYPVLGIGNDIDSEVGMESFLEKDTQAYTVSFRLNMSNHDIQNLLDSGKAVYLCEVDCPKTYYRECFTSNSPAFKIVIPRNCVAGRVTFQCTVTATDYIPNYTNSDFHRDYRGFVFNMEPGDLLAYIDQVHYDADIKYDKLHSAGSFMTIVEGHDVKYTTYYLEHDKIEIHLPPDMYECYRVQFNQVSRIADIFHASIAFNALVYALTNYCDDYRDKLWAKTISYRLQIEDRLKPYRNVLVDKDPSEILKLSQELLGNPYRRLFKTVSRLLNEDKEEE